MLGAQCQAELFSSLGCQHMAVMTAIEEHTASRQRLAFAKATNLDRDQDPVLMSMCKLLTSLLRVPVAGECHVLLCAVNAHMHVCNVVGSGVVNRVCMLTAKRPCCRCGHAQPR